MIIVTRKRTPLVLSELAIGATFTVKDDSKKGRLFMKTNRTQTNLLVRVLMCVVLDTGKILTMDEHQEIIAQDDIQLEYNKVKV